MIKPLSAVIFILGLVAPLSASIQAAHWGKLTVKDNSFTILMPGKPEFRQYDSKTNGGASHIMNASAYPDLSSTEYTVRAITDEFDAERETRLDDLCDALVKEFGTKVVSRKEISQGAFKGREITGIGPATALKARIYISGRKTYVVFAMVPPAPQYTQNVDTFLDSFEINQKS